jgi:hypothetical protein
MRSQQLQELANMEDDFFRSIQMSTVGNIRNHFCEILHMKSSLQHSH